MTKKTKKEQVIETPATVEQVETLPTQEVEEAQDIIEIEQAAKDDAEGRYKDVEVKPGRVLLEEIGTGKE